MLRLIDADALIGPIKLQEESYRRCGAIERAEAYANCLWEIEQAPTVGIDRLYDKALQTLEDMESTIPCDEMCPCDWCEEHCSSTTGAKKACWIYFLTEYKEDAS